MAIKNLWSLNIDEALATGWIKQHLSKQFEVFFPANGQLKNVDLILFDLKKRKSKTIQVKGSRTYEPRKSEINRYGNGSAAWITISGSSIFKPENRLDFYIFVLHNFVSGKLKQEIKIDFLVIPVKPFQKLVQKKKIRRGGKYHFFIWIDSLGRRSFEFNNPNGKSFDLSKYLNNWQTLQGS